MVDRKRLKAMIAKAQSVGGNVTVREHKGFAVGDRVLLAGFDGEWDVTDILLEENGVANYHPFRLRSVWRDGAEGYPTRYGAIIPESKDARHIWQWAAAEALTKIDATPAPCMGM